MRYVVVILLLASAAVSAEAVYSWRYRADDPERAYLYLDGKQIGGWDYRTGQYRPFDGTNWGPPTDTAPVRPPEQRVVVIPQQKPIVKTQPNSPFPPVRGPLRVRLGTAAGQIVTDMTMRIIDEIPGAIVDTLKRGDYQLDFKFSVTPSPQQSEGQITPPSPSQPAQGAQRRWFIPRQ
jgi:hypothetical protein